jgi:hypothetical protein
MPHQAAASEHGFAIKDAVSLITGCNIADLETCGPSGNEPLRLRPRSIKHELTRLPPPLWQLAGNCRNGTAED